MMPGMLSLEEKHFLLDIARQAVVDAAHGRPLAPLPMESLPPALKQDGAAFVTLTRHGSLRGCIGALEAYQPLAADVQEHAAAATVSDYRFPPVSPGETDSIHIEISRLTPTVPLEYSTPAELLGKLRPNNDGVLIQDGFRRATFLPQVWETLPQPEDFLAHLCMKMGAPANLWQRRILKVSTYQVEMFEEGKE